MTLQVVGSGLGRTGTLSLKAALERLLGEPCYHMLEVFEHIEDHPARWLDAVHDRPVDWDALLTGYGATVDWPAAAFWKELAAANPDAVILHSERPADAWYTSADRTIFEMFRAPREVQAEQTSETWVEMAHSMLATRFASDFLDRDTAIAAVDAWNADVRATADPDRLVIWSPGDGWEPICAALGVPVPDEPFPHTNSTAEFRERAGMDTA